MRTRIATIVLEIIEANLRDSNNWNPNRVVGKNQGFLTPCRSLCSAGSRHDSHHTDISVMWGQLRLLNTNVDPAGKANCHLVLRELQLTSECHFDLNIGPLVVQYLYPWLYH